MKRTKRFQVSLLSKGRFDEAEPEEVMIDKTTGEILVKSPLGHFASYDYISRTQSAIERIQSLCELRGFFPTIHRLTIDHVFFPLAVDDLSNIIGEPIFIPSTDTTKIREMMLYVDATSIDTTPDCVNGILPIEPDITVEIVYKKEGSDDTFRATIDEPINQFNGSILNARRLGLSASEKIYFVQIDMIRVTKNATILGINHKNLIHNIFICYKA